MTLRSSILLFGLCFGLATAAMAQDTAEQPPEPAEPATQTEAEIFPVTPAFPAADQVTKEKFGDWEKICVSSTGNCAINYLARDSDDSPVAEIKIEKLTSGGEAKAGATVITPLGTLLTKGIRLQVDGGRALQYPFSWCTRQGCFARFGLTEESVSALKRGAIATISLYAFSNQNEPIVLNVSLVGFTAAFDSLSHE